MANVQSVWSRFPMQHLHAMAHMVLCNSLDSSVVDIRRLNNRKCRKPGQRCMAVKLCTSKLYFFWCVCAHVSPSFLRLWNIDCDLVGQAERSLTFTQWHLCSWGPYPFRASRWSGGHPKSANRPQHLLSLSLSFTFSSPLAALTETH